MGRKTNEQNIAEQLKDALKVSDLIALLESLPPDMLVGIVGDFGEFHSMDEFTFTQTDAYITPDGNWRSDHREYIKVLDISSPFVAYG